LNALASGMSLQQNTHVDSMHGKQAWQTRASTTHAQKSTRRQGHRVRKQGKDTRTQRALSTSGFVDVDCVAGCVCVNMHNKQSQARAGGLSVDHPGYCLGQVGTRCGCIHFGFHLFLRRRFLLCNALRLAFLLSRRKAAEPPLCRRAVA